MNENEYEEKKCNAIQGLLQNVGVAINQYDGKALTNQMGQGIIDSLQAILDLSRMALLSQDANLEEMHSVYDLIETIFSAIHVQDESYYVEIDKIKEALQKFRLPSQHTIAKDKVTKTIFNDNSLSVFKSNKDIYVGECKKGPHKGEIISARVMLNFDNLPQGVSIESKNLSRFDNNVYNAVCNIVDNGYYCFTGQAIYKEMTGNSKAYATQSMLDAIKNSFIKMTSTGVTLNVKNMIAGYPKFETWVKQEVTDHILVGRIETTTIVNNHGEVSVDVYRIAWQSCLYLFTDTMDQIDRFDAIELNTPVKKSIDVLVFQERLLERLHTTELSEYILYDYIFEDIDFGDQNGDRKERERAYRKRKRYIEHVHKMLDYWVDKNKNLVSWKEYTGKNGSGVYVERVRKKLPAKKTAKSIEKN